MDLQILNEFSVKVNKGSGCLIQPLTDKYSYVLTARHLIKDISKDRIKITRQLLSNGKVIEESIKVIDVFHHSDVNKDASIIKIEFIGSLKKLSIMLETELFDDHNVNYLTGHPKVRTKKGFSKRHDTVTLVQTFEHNFIEIEFKNRQAYEDIDGLSGGGVINIFEKEFSLMGIQSQMVSEEKGYCLMMPISFFEEIITQNSNALAGLNYPSEKGFEDLPQSIGEKRIDSGITSNIYPPSEAPSISIDIGLMTRMVNLSSELSTEISAKLEELKEKFRQENSWQVYEEVISLRNSTNWKDYDASLRGSILRTLAMMVLILKAKEGTSEALAFADEAQTIDGSFNEQALRARIRIYKEGFKAVIKDLENYHDTETFNLWLSCFLNTRQYQQVIEAIKALPENIAPNAETHRLLSLAFLGVRSIDDAKLEIKKAIDEKPNWQFVRVSAATINYYSSISQNVLPPFLEAVPHPIFTSTVKIDDVSQQNLQRAAQEFLEIAQQYRENSKERQELESWHFACLANLFNKTNEAIDFGRQLLEKNPGNLEILSWFLFRSYDHDYSGSLHFLEREETANKISLQGLITLVRLYLKSEKNNESLSVINKRKSLVSSTEEEDLLRYWESQTYLNDGQLDKAKESAALITTGDLKIPTQFNILYYEGEKLNKWKPIIKFLKNKDENENDDEAFLTLFEIKAEKASDPNFIVKNAERYCDLIGTAGTVYQITDKLWQLGKFKKCLEILNKYVDWFPDGKLPNHLKKIKINCLTKIDAKAAVEEAQGLKSDDKSADNIMLLMDAQLSKGDLKGFRTTSKELLNHPDAKPENLLRAARIVQLTDSRLAAKFWTKANELGIPDDPQLIVLAKDVALRLGLEYESRGLMRRMMQDAHKGKGPMKVMNLRQLLKFMEKRNKYLDDLEFKYRIGETPLHILSKERNITLAEVFNIIARKNKSSNDLHNRPRLLIRHGSKPFYNLSEFKESKQWNVHLDITSLLLALKLGILDDLEKCFNKLVISSQTITALYHQLGNLYPHQKSQLDASLKIAGLIEEKKLKLVEETDFDEEVNDLKKNLQESRKNAKQHSKGNKNLLQRSRKKQIIHASSENLEKHLGRERLNLIAKALSENGYPVLLLPLNCYGTNNYSVLKFPESISNQFINCRAVLESLMAYKQISEEKYKKALSTLGQEGNRHSQISPLPKSKLFMSNDVAGILANAEILTEVCETFEVFIPTNSVEAVSEQIRYYRECEQLAEQLNELIDRINDGLEEGIYQFTLPPDETTKNEKILNKQAGEDFNSTLDLFLTEPQENDFICIDDRALNKYSNRLENNRSIPIIGVCEILQSLLANEIIDEQRFYQLLIELRACNFRYIPITENEIYFHLQRASIENGRIVENEGLTILRQYHNSTLLDKKYLQISDSKQFNEAAFVINSLEAINNCITKAWDEENLNKGIAIARSNWIIDNLFTGYISSSHLRNEKSTNKLFEINTIAFDISNLIMKGLSLGDDNKPLEPSENRLEYFNWLVDKVILNKCVSDPEILSAIGKELNLRFRAIYNQEFRTAQQKARVGYVLGRFYLDLPKFLDDEINLNEETKNWLNVQFGKGVNILGLSFEAEAYWASIAEAIAGETVTIKSIRTEIEYSVSRPPYDKEDSDAEIFPIIKFTDENNEEIGIIQDATFALLKNDQDSRLTALRKLRHWFDCPRNEFEKLINDISNIEDPVQRTGELLKIRERSTEFYYATLVDKFTEREVVKWKDLLPPSPENLSRYYRLPNNSENRKFIDIWEEAAEDLLYEENVSNVIVRSSHLPVPIPQKIIEKFSSLPEEEKIQTLGWISTAAFSPVQLLHLINLSLRTLTFESQKEFDLITNLINLLFENEKTTNNIKAFQEILKFFKDEFKSWKDTDKWSPDIYLAMLWAHSSGLYNILRSVGLAPDDIISGLNGKTVSFPETLNRKTETWNDCAYPNRINRTKILTHATSHLFSGIDLELLERFNIPKLIKNEAIRKEDEEDPAFTLLSDPKLCFDSLHSIFGGDRFDVLSPIIGSAGIEVLGSESLKQISKEYLELLIKKPEELKPWMLIYLIADDLPLYPELKELLVDAITKFDPTKIFEQEVEIPTYLLLGAAEQITHLKNEDLRLLFRSIILETAKIILNTENHEHMVETRSILIETVLAFSYHPDNPELSNEYFVTLMEEIDSIWGDMSANFGHAFSNLIWDMPVEESKAWRQLNLKIRTIR